MSLTVFPYVRDQKTDQVLAIDANVSAPFNDLFGLEQWRYRVWASKILMEVGCEILHTLKTSDIYVDHFELDKLREELLKVLNQVDEISSKLRINNASLEFRVRNGLEAVRIAQSIENAGVCIG